MAEPECPNCIDMAVKPPIMYDTDRGDSTCSGCGQVLLQRPVDESHDWRNFADSDQDNSRAGLVDPYAGGHMTTRMAAGNSRQAQQMMWSHNKVNMDTTTKNIMEANDAIQALGNMLNLTPHIQSKAKELYKEYEAKRVASMRKATSRPLMVAIIYIACNQEGFGRSFKELAKSSGVVEKEIRSFYKSLTKILPNSSTPPLDPASLVDRYCARLGDDIPEWVKIGASQIAKKASSVIEGRQPSTVAAGSILLACAVAAIPIDQEVIAKATNTITGSTVHAAYVKLAQHKSEVIPADFLTRVQQNRPAASSSQHATSSSAPSSNTTFIMPKAPATIKTDPGTFTTPTAQTSQLAQKPVSITSAPKPAPLTSAPAINGATATNVKAEQSTAVPIKPLTSGPSLAPFASATASV